MSEAGFTPGPWSVDRTVALGAYGVWTENADPRNPGHDGAGYQVQICSMNPADRDTPIKKDERNANARLIAAAPSMFAALSRLLDVIAEPNEIAREMEMDNAVQAAADAIDKAKGGHQ